MTYQQRAEILKDLPRGSMVTVLPRIRSGYKPIDAIKIEDHDRGMIVLMDDGKQYIGLRRLTCDKIKEVEEVIDRLLNKPKFERKYPYSIHEAFNAEFGFDPR